MSAGSVGGVFGMNRRGAMLDQIAEDGLERLFGLGLDRDPGIARVGSVDADLALS